MAEQGIYKSLLTLAGPVVLANLLQAGYQITDAFWVGRLGEAAVAAVSVSFPITFLLIAFGSGIAIAGSALIAQYFGAKNHKMVDHVAAQTMLMVVGLSLILGTLGVFLSPHILTLMGVEPDVYTGALKFMRVTFIGLIFSFGFAMFQGLMRGIGVVRMPVYIVLGTVILNFALDPLFIFGYGPIPAMGVMGAATATLATQGLAMWIGLMILMRGSHGIHLEWADFKPDYAFIKRAFLLGFPASIEISTRAFGLIIMSFLIASFGTLTIAAYGVGSTILQVVMIPGMGLSMALSTLVGQNIGARDVQRATQIANAGAILGFASLSIVGVIAFIFAPAIAETFVPGEPDVIAAAANFVRHMAPAWGFLGLQLCLAAVFRAAGEMRTTMIIALISQWVLQFPLAYILSKHTSLGMNGLWWSFPITNLVVVAITFCLYLQGGWKTRRLTEDQQENANVAMQIVNDERM